MEKNIKKECIYMYDWIILLYTRNEHNIVNQLTSMKKKNKKMSKNLEE